MVVEKKGYSCIGNIYGIANMRNTRAAQALIIVAEERRGGALGDGVEPFSQSESSSLRTLVSIWSAGRDENSIG